jgi:hypothetical protein
VYGGSAVLTGDVSAAGDVRASNHFFCCPDGYANFWRSSDGYFQTSGDFLMQQPNGIPAFHPGWLGVHMQASTGAIAATGDIRTNGNIFADGWEIRAKNHFMVGETGVENHWASTGVFHTKGDMHTQANFTAGLNVYAGVKLVAGAFWADISGHVSARYIETSGDIVTAASIVASGDITTKHNFVVHQHIFCGADASDPKCFWRAWDGMFVTKGDVIGGGFHTAGSLFTAGVGGQVNCRRLDTTGDIWCNGNIHGTVSDARLKDVLPDVKEEDVCARCYADVEALPVKAFRFKDAAEKDAAKPIRAGPMAQDILALGEDSYMRACVVPGPPKHKIGRGGRRAGGDDPKAGPKPDDEPVGADMEESAPVPTLAEALADSEKGNLYVDAWTMTTALLAAQKHAQREIATLQSENAALRGALDALVARVAALEHK